MMQRYENGAPSGAPVTGSATTTAPTAADLTFGPFFGTLDEFELEPTAHSADWMHAEYASQSGQAITFE